MKISMQRMPTMLAVMAMTIFAFTFTACSDEDDPVAEVTYSYGFSDMSASHPDFLAEMSKIENAFKSALGITATPFTKNGPVEECDRQVYEACKKAFDSLKGEAWQGDYTFQVTNVSTGEVVCTAIFSAGKENFIEGSGENVKVKTDLSTAKVGDYYTTDGTLIEVPEETILSEELKKKIIGIVFHVGHNDLDKSDYSQSGIGKKECHGYVVALTDVNKVGNDRLRLRWGYKDGESSMNVGTSIDENDWNGYNNHKAIEYFADNNNEGWLPEHFEAAYWCGRYGTKDSRYDWQKQYTAPENSSGWFLPSCDQLKSIYYVNRDNADLLEKQIEKVKSLDTENIKWFNMSWYYWSSSEYSEDSAWFVGFEYGDAVDYLKYYTRAVRAVLVF